jgi:cbb3-type cytochrome oxidase subunit 3
VIQAILAIVLVLFLIGVIMSVLGGGDLGFPVIRLR